MKKRPSFSSSSSSSSAASPTSSRGDANFSNSKNAGGCLAGALRRLLCSGGLPTYPSDTIKTNFRRLGDGDVKCHGGGGDTRDVEEKIESPPGLVARLMGLEALPPPNSISRSRSMNALNYRRDGEPESDQRHRRLRTSLSFRERPAFIERENEDFFVLTFERKQRNGDTMESKKHNSPPECKGEEDKGAEKSNQEEEEEEEEKEEEEGGKSMMLSTAVKLADSSLDLRPKQEVPRFRKGLKKTTSAAEEADSASENSSPVSVLESGEFLQLHASEKRCDSGGSNWRRKLSTELEYYYDSPPPPPPCTSRSGSLQGDCETAVIQGEAWEGKRKRKRKKEKLSWNGSCKPDTWDKICRLAGVDSTSTTEEEAWKADQRGDISADFGSPIFDELLQDLVDQLVESFQNF